MAIFLERDADCLRSSRCHCHLKTTVISCLINTQNDFAFLVSAYPGCPLLNWRLFNLLPVCCVVLAFLCDTECAVICDFCSNWFSFGGDL